MSDQRNGGIVWTDDTWNCLRGCSKVSAGCANCYAESMAARFCGEGMPYHGLIRDGHWWGNVRFIPEKLDAPLRWKRPRRVFVNSMSDLFHESVSNEQIAAIFGVMAACPQHVFQTLTKRPERMLEWFECTNMADTQGPLEEIRFQSQGYFEDSHSDREWTHVIPRADKWPLPNVHLGVSCENQATADERIPLLLQCPAAVRWVSAEPLLGAIDFTDISTKTPTGVEQWNALDSDEYDDDLGAAGPSIDWIVVGGESGPHARPMHPDWARSILDQCKAAGVPFHFKQLGDVFQKTTTAERVRLNDIPVREWRACKKRAGHLLDGHEYRMYPGDKWAAGELPGMGA